MPRGLPLDLLESCRAYIAVTPSGFISHITAAKIHALYLPSRLDTSMTMDVSRRVGEPQPRRKHVKGHGLALGPGDLVRIGGVPVTSVRRTFLDLAPLLSVDELVAIGDQIICSHTGSCVPAKIAMVEPSVLNAYIAEHAGSRGMCKLRTALELLRVGADSPPESRLRLMIARSPLPDFEHNVEICDAAGNALVGPDLACKEFRTCAEYDGGHHFTPGQQSKDHDRDFVTRSLGWHQVLLNKDDMRAGELVVVTKLARMLKLGGWPDPEDLAGRSLLGVLNTRKTFE